MTLTPLLLFLICLGLILLLTLISLLLTPSAASGGESIGRGTRMFLLLLRVAIGWHFMVEGFDKLNNPNWSSENYLRASSGPLASYFRGVADEPLLAKLTPPEENALPPALDKEWQRYFDKFKEEFELNETQTKVAETKLSQAKKETMKWMVSKQSVEKLSPYVERSTTMTVAERIAYYNKLLEQVDKVLSSEVVPFGPAAENKLKRAREEADYIINNLKKDLAKQTQDMKKALSSVLPKDDQRANMPAIPAPPMEEWTQLQWSDHVVPWALTIVGGMLILGFLTRPACLVGAAWMLMLYLTMMPLPGWPEPARTEGHYLYVNKNLIEMLALLVLATTRSGRWLGLDALFGVLFGSRKKTAGTSSTPPAKTKPAGKWKSQSVSAS